MRNIVIVGAGPVGLYLAIKLTQIIEQYGLETKVIVVDPRLGDYDRPGIVARNVLDIIRNNLQQEIDSIREGDDSGTSMFIQDLEKALLNIAKAMRVECVREGFNNVSAGGINIGAKKIFLPCDFLIDCSGARRAVVRAINDSHFDKKPFTIERIGDNPIKDHFIAYVRTDQNNAKKIAEKMRKNPVNWALTMEELRTRFNWPYFIEPEFTMRKYTIENEKEKEKSVRFYLYFEIPPNIKSASVELQTEWLKTLLKLKTENDDIHFDIEQGKMKFSPFIVDPDKVKEAFYIGDENTPFTIVCGDAQIQPDYRAGIGIWSGISRANAFIGALEKNKNELLLNAEKYAADLLFAMGKHESELKKDYDMKITSIVQALESAENRYLQALELPLNTNQRDIIQQGLEEIRTVTAREYLGKANIAYKNALKNNEIALDKRNDIAHPSELERAKRLLIQAIEKVPPNRDVEKKLILEKLLQMAKNYKSLAAAIQKAYKYPEAKKFYEESLQFYTNYFPNLYREEEVKILSNLVIIANKRKDYAESIRCAERALAISPYADIKIIETVVIKVKYNLCIAMCEQLLDKFNKKEDSEKIAAFKSITALFIEIDGQVTNKNDIQPLVIKYQALSDEIAPLVGKTLKY